MDLKNLYNDFLANGYVNFYIDGIGGPMQDDVHRLGFDGSIWEVYYIERGKKSQPIFSTTDKNAAIKYYTDFVSKIEHWHLIAFTRSSEIFNDFKCELEKLNIQTIQNDIPHYKVKNDRVYRLFVVNKDIFIAKAHIEDIPYFDSDLKYHGR